MDAFSEILPGGFHPTPNVQRLSWAAFLLRNRSAALSHHIATEAVHEKRESVSR